jgi:hypothetical protein
MHPVRFYGAWWLGWYLFLSLSSARRVDGSRSYGLFSAAAASLIGGAESHNTDSSSWFDDMAFEDAPVAAQIPVDDVATGGPLDHLQLHPLLQIPMSISLTGSGNLQAVRTYCDTGAQRTVMSWDCAQQVGLLQHLDRSYAGIATGVGSCRVLGRIPAGIADLHLHGSLTVKSPAITIIESTGTQGVELLLGLDILRDYDAVLDLKEEELTLRVQNEEHRIPFLRPRASPSLGSARSHGGPLCTSVPLAAQRKPRNDPWNASDEEDENCESDGEGLDMSGV